MQLCDERINSCAKAIGGRTGAESLDALALLHQYLLVVVRVHILPDIAAVRPVKRHQPLRNIDQQCRESALSLEEYLAQCNKKAFIVEGYQRLESASSLKERATVGVGNGMVSVLTQPAAAEAL